MKSNMKLEWYGEDNYCRGCSARNEFRDAVRWDSEEAVRYDLVSAVKSSYYPEEKVQEVLDTLKRLIKIQYPEVWKDCEYAVQGMICKNSDHVYEPKKSAQLWKLSDNLTYSQIKNIILLAKV